LLPRDVTKNGTAERIGLPKTGQETKLTARQKKERGAPIMLGRRAKSCQQIFSASGRSNQNQALFVYQSALIGVKLAHFSGKSSKAKIAVTGQTGTHAPQSIHSTGLMYSWGSDSNLGSSFRG
jgi:hypothetical protein